MKNLIVIGMLAGVLVLALGLAGLAFAQSQIAQPQAAQTPTPEAGQGPYGPGMMGGFGRGMMGGRDFGRMNLNRAAGRLWPMHEYMEQAWSKVLGLPEAELEQRFEAGETMGQIAADLGYSQDEFAELMVTARTEALNQAVEAGILTREQADWMIEHMQQRQAAGRGPGSGGCPGGGMGWRWNP